MQIKKERKNKLKINKSQLLIVGSLLLIISGSFLIFTKYYELQKEDKKEQETIDKFIEKQKSIVQESTIEEEIIEETNEEESVEVDEDYIAVIEIPKINLRKGLYSKASSNNNVNKNIQILKEADMPDKIKGNFILAGHSGSSAVSYFKSLDKLELEDIAYVYYNGGRYAYKLVNIYEIDKTGKANIVRNASKTTMTLITCKGNTEKQVVYIFELKEDTDE